MLHTRDMHLTAVWKLTGRGSGSPLPQSFGEGVWALCEEPAASRLWEGSGGRGRGLILHLLTVNHGNVLSLQKINTGNKGKAELCTFDWTTSRILKIFGKRNHCAAVIDAAKTISSLGLC